MNAAGTAYPPPETATGTLKSIAAIGAAPVTMQNSTCGSPSASFASACSRSGIGVRADGAAVTLLMRPPAWSRDLAGSKPARPRPAHGPYPEIYSLDIGHAGRGARRPRPRCPQHAVHGCDAAFMSQT